MASLPVTCVRRNVYLNRLLMSLSANIQVRHVVVLMRAEFVNNDGIRSA